ncbi:MAG: DUF1146 family protein [Erysipelotrichaceae bacterium]
MGVEFQEAMIYALAFVICGLVLSEIDFARIFKKGKVKFALVLYFITTIALAYLVGSFILIFI